MNTPPPSPLPALVVSVDHKQSQDFFSHWMVRRWPFSAPLAWCKRGLNGESELFQTLSGNEATSFPPRVSGIKMGSSNEASLFSQHGISEGLVGRLNSHPCLVVTKATFHSCVNQGQMKDLDFFSHLKTKDKEKLLKAARKKWHTMIAYRKTKQNKTI